jgi:dipeptidyl aminopeptidase/acylaminoacyl peptidase
MFRILSTALVALLTFAGADAHSAATPVMNGRIAFSVSTGIASMNPDGSGQWGVELQVGDTQPAWSPDGTKLAVVTHWAGRSGIELLQPNGDALGMLTTDGGDSYPAWSPDGRTVAFTNGSNVFLVGAAGWLGGSSPRTTTRATPRIRRGRRTDRPSPSRRTAARTETTSTRLPSPTARKRH